MDIIFLLKGIIVGFLVAVPIGPAGNLCIDRTLSNGRASGLVSGLGAVTTDGFYSAVAAYGLTVISDFILSQQHWFRLAGGIFLVFLGVKIFMSKPPVRRDAGSGESLIADYMSSLFITLANPAPVLVFAAIFAGLGLGTSVRAPFSATAMVVGVVLGSALCWFALATWVGAFRKRMQAATIQVIRRISGSIILVFAATALLFVLRK